MSLASCPLEEGLAFNTAPESVYAVQDYALATGKSVRVERASGADRRIVCLSEQPCAFFVQIYRQRMADKKTYGKWYIASLELTHSDACDAGRRLTTRQIAGLPAFMEAVQTNPKASIEALVATVLERHGVPLEKQIRLVYRARDLVRNGKAVVRSSILPSQDAPLPPRQFVQRRVKTSQEAKVLKNPDRMAWTQTLVESLLIERIVKHGREFVEAGEISQHRQLWEVIHKDFNAMHQLSVSVTQLRAKFRYLQEQYVKVRAEEQEAERDAEKLVVYPRCWDMLAEYFGDEAPHISPDMVEAKEELDVMNPANSQAMSISTNAGAIVATQSGPVPFVQSMQSVAFQPVPVQTPFQSSALQSIPAQSTPVFSAPTQLVVSQTQASVIQQETSPEVASKGEGDVVEKLESIQNTQDEMSKSMDSMKQVVEQSNEAIRGLQKALNQSNEVNAALLDFLRRQPSSA
ncbi:Mutatorlike Transposase [Phytophthora cinnamomi]|uniref:Mutatorlike Transposase n=1 Tax=Phytophthora cinnamomi TaxID=4785 RepID=UPI00355A7284|nr:Mutatorlike Transposase [Phytophthora cinnamomi]